MSNADANPNINQMSGFINDNNNANPSGGGRLSDNADYRERRQKTALYREWRPRTFSDVVEQEHVVTTLKNSILRGRLAHAYLFCGTRGTGKTTLAQILSRAVNCLNPKDAEPCNECEICAGILSGRLLDVVEIDAASNNSVDNIRGLRDAIIYAPAEAKYKVYIIDEVHMLSGGAFNALLKTLEEPPAYALFILATTEPHKLPPTILSRCQRFDFRRITDAAIVERLELIAGDIGAKADRDALRLIAKLSDGALRDAISIFDQCASSNGGVALTLDDVLRMTGRPRDDNLVECARILINRQIGSVPRHVAAVSASGLNLNQYIDGMTVFFRHLLMIKLGQDREAFPELPDGIYREAEALASLCDTDYLLAVASEFSTMAYAIKDSVNQTVLLEVALAKICLGRFRSDSAIVNLNARVDALERKLEQAGRVPAPVEASVKRVSSPAETPEENVPAPVEANAEYAPAPAETPAEYVLAPDEATAEPVSAPAVPVYEPAERLEVPENQAPPEVEPAPATPVFDDAQWRAIIEKFKNLGNPRLYTLLQTTTTHIAGDNFRIVLPMDMANHSAFLTNPDNLSKLRAEIQSATGRAYAVQVISEHDKYRDIAKQMTDKFNIPVKIHP